MLLIKFFTSNILFVQTKIPTSHPWPIFNPLQDESTTNQMIDPCFASSSKFIHLHAIASKFKTKELYCGNDLC